MMQSMSNNSRATKRHRAVLVIGVLIAGTTLADACSRKKEEPQAAKAPAGASEDILARAPLTDRAEVKHVLIGWAALAPAYRGQIDPRAAARSKEEADKLAAQILDRVRSGESIEKLMAQFSEDPGSAQTGRSYAVAPDAPLVAPFKNLSLRLQPSEAGLVQSDYGWHVIQRVK
jgi:hypothetical protein